MEPHHIFGGFLIVQDLGALHSIRLGRRLPRRRDLRRVECLGLKAPVLEVSTGVEVDRVRQPRRRHLLRCADNEVLTSATGRMITRWHDPGSMGVHGSACGVVEKDTAGDRCGLGPPAVSPGAASNRTNNLRLAIAETRGPPKGVRPLSFSQQSQALCVRAGCTSTPV